MQVSATAPVGGAAASGASAANDTAASAFGLGFESLLKIILTQLTYQDPLKPIDNFEFVSQLAQFSQIQLGQTSNDRLQSLVTAQATMQAATLLGRQVDVPSSGATLSGKVSAVTFDNGDPRITIETGDGQTVSGLSLASVTQIREAN